MQTASIIVGLLCGAGTALGVRYRLADYEGEISRGWRAIAIAFATTAFFIVSRRLYLYEGQCEGSIGDPSFPCSLWQFVEDDLRTYSHLLRQLVGNALGVLLGIIAGSAGRRLLPSLRNHTSDPETKQ